MKKKVDINLLKEELSKFKFLTEYAFYNEKEGVPEYKDLLLGNELEEDEEMSDDDMDSATNDIANDLGVPTDDGATNDAPIDGAEPNGEQGAETGDSGVPIPPAPEVVPTPAPVDDSTEIDVTELVKGTEDAKDSANSAERNSEIIMKQLSDLEARLNSMSKVSNQIEDLEAEIIKRAPTPNEKLELQSVVSGPYTQKLSDYWSDKEGMYDVMNTDKKKEEYILTQDDVDSTYSDANIRKSFDVTSNDYEEEDI